MRRDDNGFFYFVGRADDMFVCSGEKHLSRRGGEAAGNAIRRLQAGGGGAAGRTRRRSQGAGGLYRDPPPTPSQSVEEIRKFTIANGPAYQQPAANRIRQ